MSDKVNLHPKLSVDNSNSVSNNDLVNNNPRYRIDSGKKYGNHSDSGQGYVQYQAPRHGNHIVAPNTNNLNGLSRMYGKQGPLRSIQQTNSYRDGQQYGRSMPVE